MGEDLVVNEKLEKGIKKVKSVRKSDKKVLKKFEGEFIVTMEYPDKTSPKSVFIEIDELKATLKKVASTGVGIITSSHPPRAG